MIKKIYLRYYPPGIAFEYGQTAKEKTEKEDHLKHIDLLDLNVKSNPAKLAHSILQKEQKDNGQDAAEGLLTYDLTHAPLTKALAKLQRKLREQTEKKFYLHKSVPHILPLTNVCFDRSGERCLTGCYDRTCRVIDTRNVRVEHTLLHDNVVFSVGFNFPKCNKVATASFDGTAKVWNPSTGQLLSTLYGHEAEVVSVEFDPCQGDIIATASMDGTARVYDVETTVELQALQHHGAEVISSHFSRDANLLLTASFDHTAAVWDLRMKGMIARLRGHSAELSSAIWNFAGDLIATASLDNTAHVWDLRRLPSAGDDADAGVTAALHHIREHRNEVLDVAFDYTGKLLATASSDCTARIFSVRGALQQLSVLSGHTDEVSKVSFSPPGAMVLTASADHTARLWLTESGRCSQVLAGHESEVFSSAFSYTGDMIITASKDNTCRLWR